MKDFEKFSLLENSKTTTSDGTDVISPDIMSCIIDINRQMINDFKEGKKIESSTFIALEIHLLNLGTSKK